MTIRRKLTQKVPEASYLTAENVARYRPVMRYFYEQHEAHRYWFHVEAVWRFVHDELDDRYTTEMCEADLSSLVDWGNLTAEQDRHGRSIEEFKKRRLRYQITDYGVAFERLLVQLEQAHGQGGSLDPTFWDALLEHLEALGQTLDQDRPEADRVARHWREAHQAFNRLGQDANDFLARLRDARPEDPSQIEGFLAYKQILIEYLSRFATSLNTQAERIRAGLRAWGEGATPAPDGTSDDRRESRDQTPAADRRPARLVELLTELEMAKPLPDGTLPERDAVRRHFRDQWLNLWTWFFSESGLDALRRVTTEAIESVVRQTQRLMDRRQTGYSRRRELEVVARAFGRCRRQNDLDQANRLAAWLFGCAASLHLLGGQHQFLADPRLPPWQQPVEPLSLTPISRRSSQRAGAEPVPDRREQERALLLAKQAERQREANLWDALFAGNRVDLGSLELADSVVRGKLLLVLSRCLASPDRRAAAPDGSIIRLQNPAERRRGTLQAPDGTLHLPRFVLERRKSHG